MSSHAFFAYYADLEVERTASDQEITSSYRRLARIHHPDKNPDNVEEATASFQKIQHAYDTLSDPTKRQRYDLEESQNMLFEQSYDDTDVDDDWSDDLEDSFDDGPGFDDSAFWEMFRNVANFNASQRMNRGKRHSRNPLFFGQDWRERMDRMKYEAAERAAEEEAAEARRKAEQEDRENARHQVKELGIDKERQRQDSRWAMFKATTADEKIQQCLHSSFCTRVKQQKKTKCAACSVKRGMTAFVCPHCTASLCQLCVTNFAAKREREELNEKIPKSPASPKADTEPTMDEEETKPPNDQAGKDGKRRRQHRKTASKGKLACFNCGETGHFARDCAEPNHSSKQGSKPAHGGGQKKKQGGGGRGGKAGAKRQAS